MHWQLFTESIYDNLSIGMTEHDIYSVLGVPNSRINICHNRMVMIYYRDNQDIFVMVLDMSKLVPTLYYKSQKKIDSHMLDKCNKTIKAFTHNKSLV